MPVALDPNATFDLWLKSDAKVPLAKRPVFVCRHLTDRSLKRMAGMQGEINDAEGMDRIDLMHDALAMSLIGWRNMVDPQTTKAIPFSADKTQDILQAGEVVELIEKIAGHVQTSAGDRKKSARPSRRRSPRKSSKRSR